MEPTSCEEKQTLTPYLCEDCDCESKTEMLNKAAENGHVEYVKAALESGAHVNNDKGYYTPLTFSAWKGHDKCVELLIEAGADVNKLSGWRESTAVMMASSNGHDKCVDLLINAGADVNIQGCDRGDTAIAFAARYDKCVKLLIEAGADVNKQDYECNTALLVTMNHLVFY